ncbi:MAG: PadR family transcriptional regulator PadR [Candidatus Paceibacteria bacterium]|jgi:PadR family transcriptional regulator PadR
MASRKIRYIHGAPRLLILKLLEEQEMYGYKIGRSLRNSTNEIIALGEGIIYPLLHELEHDGLLRSRKTKSNGRPRVYYRTTAKGRRHLKRDADVWWSVAHAVSSVLGGKDGAIGDPNAARG